MYLLFCNTRMLKVKINAFHKQRFKYIYSLSVSMQKKLFLFIVVFYATQLIAQDPHFSQFFASPLTLNPAFTGKFNGNYRVAANYRNQWPTINNAFITATGSIDFRVAQERLPQNDAFGLGVLFLTDKSANGAVQQSFGTISTAYHKGLDEEGYHQISVGVQATYANMLINTADLRFEDQLTTLGFTGVTSEIFNSGTLNSKYFDINAGFLYSGSTTDRNNFYFGVSLYHINRPVQTFTGANYVINPRATIQAGTYFALGPATTLNLSALQTFQGGATETVMGGAFQFIANANDEKPTSFYAGSWYRFKDALIPYIGLEAGDWRLGATYDVNTSSLKTASARQGGFEVSIIYAFRPNVDRPINCPKF
jgi:type IX secretion system PorP/SprF family membrane protein